MCAKHDVSGWGLEGARGDTCDAFCHFKARGLENTTTVDRKGEKEIGGHKKKNRKNKNASCHTQNNNGAIRMVRSRVIESLDRRHYREEGERNFEKNLGEGVE